MDEKKMSLFGALLHKIPRPYAIRDPGLVKCEQERVCQKRIWREARMVRGRIPNV